MKNPSKTITLFLPSQFASEQSSPNVDNLEDAADIDELIEEAMEENAEQKEKKSKIRRSEVQLGEIIGKGGMGLVHIGNQAIIERQVAIKKLRTVHPKLSKALIHEAKVMGSLEHPNIIPVHAVNIINETEPEVVMKYIQGTSFDKKISKKPTEKEIRENLQVLQQVCRPLEFAHSQEILHRDIKPENIMLGTFGEVYLLDWGLALETDKARSTAKGLVGTPSYMAPEMLSGDPTRVGVFTDVYLLGAVLHEVITGKRRHEGKTIKEALNQAERSVPYLYPKGIQSLLGEIANKACSRAVKYRYKSVMEFRIAISDIIIRWDALSVSQAAEEKLAQLKELHTDPSGGQIQAHALYNQARFGFEQSLKLFPKNHRAKKGIDNCIHAMANLMIEMGQLDYGQSLLQELSRHDASLENKLLYLLAEEEKKKKAAKDLKRIADR
ncbi:MAG: serine/threonine-protein kinase, partial [Myxococcota bacterium]|nr:serine/threonine-protein kinase [Myxococcota bacterium]